MTSVVVQKERDPVSRSVVIVCPLLSRCFNEALAGTGLTRTQLGPNLRNVFVCAFYQNRVETIFVALVFCFAFFFVLAEILCCTFLFLSNLLA